MKFLICCFIPLLLISSCAIGPLMNHETARTVGKGSSEFELGFGNSLYIAKLNVGLMDQLDIGAQLEAFSLGAKLKYSFLPASSEGIALALQVGTGISIGGSHQYGDFIVSYRVNEAFEPYGLFRYVYVKNDPIETRSMRDGSVYVLSPASQYRYAQIMAGARIYLKDTKLYLAVEYSHLLDIANDNLILGEVNLYNAGLGIRF